MYRPDNSLYEFGPFRLDLNKRVLFRGTEPVALTPKAFETLVVLVQNKQTVVLKDDLMKSVWPDSFVEESNLSQNIFTLRRALGDSQAKRFIVTVPGRGYQFTENVREVRPETGELVIESHTRSRVVIEEARPKSWALWAGLATLLVAAAGGALFFYPGPRGSDARNGGSTTPATPTTEAIKVRRSVAVLGFRNISGNPEQAWLSTAIREMLDTELAAGGQLRTVSGEQVARGKLEWNVPDADSLAKDSLTHLHANLNADYVVIGSFAIMGSKGKDHLRLDLRLQDALVGETILEEAFTGTTDELFDLVSQAGTKLRGKLGVGDVSAEQAAGVRASLPSNRQAARLYAEGLAKLRNFDAPAAKDLLLKAVKVEPSNALLHSSLAAAWSALGYEAKAQEEAKRAFDLSTGLPRADRLSIEGRYRELTHDFPAAIEIYRTLRNFFPDDLEYGLLLASAQSHGGIAKDALETVARMRSLPEPENKDARIDLAEAKVAEQLGDFRLMQQAAAAAGQKAQAQGSRWMMAQSKEQEGWAWARLGDLQKAMATYSQAQELAAGNPNTLATVLYGIGTMLLDKGDYPGARKYYEDSQGIYRQIGSHQNEAFATGGIGSALFSQGKYVEAKRYYQEALQVHRELADPIAMGDDLGNIANALVNLGQLAEATRLQEQSLQAYRQVGAKLGEATTLTGLGSLLVDRGQLGAAKQVLEQAMDVEKQSGQELIRGYVLYSMAQILRAQDRLKDAQSTSEEAIALRKQHNEEGLAADSQTQLAEILLDEGRAAEAESLLRAAAEVFEKNKVDDSACQAASVLTHALLAQGKTADAQAAADHADRLSHQTSDYHSRYEASMAAAAAKAEAGKMAEADKALQAVQEDAHRHGFVGYELEARLRLGELDLRAGKANTGKARLEKLQHDAQGKGFLLIARKAAAARR